MSSSNRDGKVVVNDNEGEDVFSFASPSKQRGASRIANEDELAATSSTPSTPSRSVREQNIPRISDIFTSNDHSVDDDMTDSVKDGGNKSAGKKRDRKSADTAASVETGVVTKGKMLNVTKKKKRGTKLPSEDDYNPEEGEEPSYVSGTRYGSKPGKIDWNVVNHAWETHITPIDETSRIEDVLYYPDKAVRSFLESCKRPTRLLDLAALSGAHRILEASRVTQAAFSSDAETRLRIASAIAQIMGNERIFPDTEMELGTRAQDSEEDVRLRNLAPDLNDQPVELPRSQASFLTRMAMDTAVQDAINACSSTGIGSGKGKKALMEGGRDREVKGEGTNATLGGFLRVVTSSMESGGKFAGMSLTVGPRLSWLRSVRKAPICALSKEEEELYLAIEKEDARLLSPLGWFVTEVRGLTLEAFQDEIPSETRDKIIDDFVDLPQDTIETYKQGAVRALFQRIGALITLDKATRSNIQARVATGAQFPLTTNVATQVSYSFAVPIPPLFSFEKLAELLAGRELENLPPSVEFTIACARALKGFAPSFTPRIRLTGQRAGASEYIPVADANSRYLTMTFIPSVSAASGSAWGLSEDAPAPPHPDVELRTSSQVEAAIHERVVEGLKGIVESLGNRDKIDGTAPLSIGTLDEIPGLIKVSWTTKVHEVESSELDYLNGNRSRPLTREHLRVADNFDVSREEGPIHKEKRGRKPGPVEMSWRVKGMEARPSKRSPKPEAPPEENIPKPPAQSPPRPAILDGILRKIAKSPASPSRPILGSVLRTMSTSVGSPGRQ